MIPLGVSPRDEPVPTERAAIRAKLGLPEPALVVACVGFVHPDKLVVEALDAFSKLAASDPHAIFLSVGQESDNGAAREHAARLGLNDRARFLGRRTAGEYAEAIASADIGISLRRPPTNGETSAALLDLLASGVPTIVTDVATFADYPDTVVRKVRWDASGPEALTGALRELAGSPRARTLLAESARQYVEEVHAWPHAAARYVELIERCAAASREPRGVSEHPVTAWPAQRPHFAGAARTTERDRR